MAFRRQRSPFINIYGSFGHPSIWPRGFPVDELKNVTEDGWHSVRRNEDSTTYAYVQQYLADLDPDVDAVVSSHQRCNRSAFLKNGTGAVTESPDRTGPAGLPVTAMMNFA